VARTAGLELELAAVLTLMLAVAMTIGGIAQATTFARMSPEDLAREAAAIVRGRCVGSVFETREGELWTVTSIEVRETWKGEPPRVVRVWLLGGRTANITSRVSGVPRFRAGEDVILFLSRTASGEFSVLSWAQGTFRVRRDRASGDEMVMQDTAAAGVLMAEMSRENGAGLAAHSAAVSGVRVTPLNEFRRRIQDALARDGASGGAGVGESAARRMR
jgi:hypothetical protein